MGVLKQITVNYEHWKSTISNWKTTKQFQIQIAILKDTLVNKIQGEVKKS